MIHSFSDIYLRDGWRNGSGPGSSVASTIVYRELLVRFMRDREVQTVLDIGCGDWQFSKEIDWTGRKYTGIDVVPLVIDENCRRYRRQNIQFRCCDVTAKSASLPEADLLLLKDVLQHWSHTTIERFLPKIRKYKHALITNSRIAGEYRVNAPINDGDFSPIDLFSLPLSLIVARSGLRVRQLMCYNAFGDDIKQVCLFERESLGER